jgi:hypothetical protein
VGKVSGRVGTEEGSVAKPKQVKQAVIVGLLLAEIAACRREMVRLRRMLKELVGEVNR